MYSLLTAPHESGSSYDSSHIFSLRRLSSTVPTEIPTLGAQPGALWQHFGQTTMAMTMSLLKLAPAPALVPHYNLIIMFFFPKQSFLKTATSSIWLRILLTVHFRSSIHTVTGRKNRVSVTQE